MWLRWEAAPPGGPFLFYDDSLFTRKMEASIDMDDKDKVAQEENKAPTALRLSEVIIPPAPEYLSTGVSGLDACLAADENSPQGLPLGCSVLLVGQPGGGKSTLCTVMSDAAKSCLYIAGEERAARVKARWNRLGLGKNGADPWITRLSDGLEIADKILELQPKLTVIDSAQTLSWNGSIKYDAQAEAVKFIEGIVVGMGNTVVFVSHVSKTGRDHAGSQSLSHLVDVHLHMAVNAKKSERVLEVRKNRHGRAGFQVPIFMGPTSITIGTPAPITGDGSMMGARSALERAAETAYDLLSKGESLNAYDFDKPSPPVSGGLWRAALELATKRMARDGFKIIEYKEKGRKTYKADAPDPAPEPIVVKAEEPEEEPFKGVPGCPGCIAIGDKCDGHDLELYDEPKGTP